MMRICLLIKRLLPLCLGLLVIPPAFAVEEIHIQALFTNKAMVQIDGKQQLLTAGKRGYKGVKLISANSKEAVLEIDGKRSTHKLGSRISSSYTSAKSRDKKVQVWPDQAGMYTVHGSINGFTVRFLVDTGATSIAMNSNQAKRLGIDYRVSGRPGRVSTASGLAESYGVTLKRVKVGEIELKEVDAVVIDGDFPRDVLLGMSFLGRLDLNRQGALLELRKKGY